MHLIRLQAEGIHGFLKFTIRFNRQLTFITGINGSGKTSAINAMVALIAPDFSTLADLIFTTIRLEVENDGKRILITAVSHGHTISLSISGIEEQFEFVRYHGDPALQLHRGSEGEAEFYRDLMLNRAAHPVLTAINSLPTPMFLGIDRRASFDEDVRRRYPVRPARMGRNIFSKSLGSSLATAAALAQDKYKDALIHSGRLAERLQREMLLSLLTPSSAERSHGAISVPTMKDIAEIDSVRTDLDAIAEIMRLPPMELRRRVDPLLDKLQSSARQIPEGIDIQELFSSDATDSPVLSAIFEWSTNQTHLRRFKKLSETVAQYNRSKARTLHQTTRYRELVNGFLLDSGKSIVFNEDGSLHVKIEGAKGDRHISYLSSGEAQIFVILTHLAFHPLARRDNVFIIDEPELSLHVQWQEKFVESIISANDNIQYILATHSPSIILERVDDCIDISRRPRKSSIR